ncbi:hypothetical protein DFS34DRAFT_87469 [Phlyctochytrium arcticum]|nr:hypothetical protein DFS34DRAFT_87469 [Phlyctochytrium arcticum]
MHDDPTPPSENAAPATANSSRKGRVQACDRCRVRKRKCNGVRPTCNNCEKARMKGVANISCKYAEKKARPRRQLRAVLMERLGALEALLKPLQEGANASANASTVAAAAAARAEMAGIIAGLSNRRGSGGQQDDGDDSGDEHNDDDDDRALGEDWNNAENGSSTTSGALPLHLTTSMSTTPLSAIFSPPASEAEYSDDSPDMLNLAGSGVAVFDPIAWPSLAPPSAHMGSAEMLYALDPNSFVMSGQPVVSSAAPVTSSASSTLPSSHVPNGKSYASNSSINSLPTGVSTLTKHSGVDVPHLYTHLIALYFSFVNSCMPLFDESYFFSNLIPVNNHPPGLLYAIYAYGCVHSRHPALYQAPFHSPRNASEMFHAESTQALDGITDTITRLQVLIMLGKWSFGMNQPAKGLQFFSSAVQAAERSRLGFARGHEANRLVPLWKAPNWLNPTHTIPTLRMTWGYCFWADTMMSIACELSPIMEESNYAHILAEAQDAGEAGLLSCLGPQLDSQGENPGLWTQLLQGHPTFTIHDFRPNAWTPDSDALERQCFRTSPWVFQLMFLLRRVQRFSRDVPFDASRYEGTAASLVFSVLPKPSGNSAETRERELLRLHNVLIDWWASLPEGERAFTDLQAFRDSRNLPPLPSVAQLASFQFAMMNTYYIAGFSLLHHREEPDMLGSPASLFKTTSMAGVPLASTSEILTVAIRAVAFIIRSIYAMNGFNAIPPPPPVGGDPALDFTASSPAPPLLFIQNPITCFSVWCVGAAFFANHGRRRARGDSLDPHMEGILQEGITIVETLFLPMLDSGRRSWPVMGVYANRLREAMDAVKRGEEVVGLGPWQREDREEFADVTSGIRTALSL